MATDSTPPDVLASRAAAKGMEGADLIALHTGPAESLEMRQQRERLFHDVWASEVDPHELDPIRRAFCSTTPETTYAFRALGDLKGKRVLDLGCGAGETTVWLALQGAQVDGVDISPGMVEVTRGLAEVTHRPRARLRPHRANCKA
ncbi:MAG TPA: methyltransferase domain-containing protein, partial [Planctomycetota bacterium]|nr:methyltransferase domain-containing protein [Planctomycetota bacterium]